MQARCGHSFRFRGDARRDPALREPARATLEAVGLGARADVLAGHLAHGEQRQLELARARRPAAIAPVRRADGRMGREDGERMVELLRRLRGRHAPLLVEHDVDAVFALADRSPPARVSWAAPCRGASSLILDEATEGLAPLVRAQMWKCLAQLEEGGMAMLVIDENVQALADRHCIIEKGRTVWADRPAELLADAGQRRRFLGL